MREKDIEKVMEEREKKSVVLYQNAKLLFVLLDGSSMFRMLLEETAEDEINVYLSEESFVGAIIAPHFPEESKISYEPPPLNVMAHKLITLVVDIIKSNKTAFKDIAQEATTTTIN